MVNPVYRSRDARLPRIAVEIGVPLRASQQMAQSGPQGTYTSGHKF